MSEIAVPDNDALSINGSPRLYVPAQVNRSIWTGRRKVIGAVGPEIWSASVTLEMLSTESDERAWRAFFYALRGQTNWFKLLLPCNTHAGSKPTVDTGASDGYTLPLTGLATSQTILVAGQFMTVPLPSGKFRAVCLTADLVSDGSGDATAAFEPALTETPTGSATVETKDPYLPVSLTDNQFGLEGSSGVSSKTFDVEEAL